VSRKNSSGVTDLAIGELEKEIAKNAAFIVNEIRDHAADRQHVIVYTPGVASAHAVAALLNDHQPGSAVSIDAKTPQGERDQALADFDAGRIRYIVNCAIFLYGLDVPRCDCIVDARPTEDIGTWLQMIGRGGRPEPGIGELATKEERLAAIAAGRKPNFLLLLLSGNAGRHSLITAEDLDTEASAKAKAKAREMRQANPSLNVYDALKDAKAWERGENIRIAKLAREMVVKSAGGPFDPFKAAGISNREGFNRFANKLPGPPSEPMFYWLKSNGLNTNISQGEALRMRAKEAEWEKAGRAIYSQRIKLNRLGLPHDLSRQQANDLLWECKQAPGGIPAKAVVERIVSGRDVGSEG